MLTRYGLPALAMVAALWGLVGFAAFDPLDRDPQLYYFTAGKCLGRPTWYYCAMHDTDDPLYVRGMMNGGKLLLHFDKMRPYRDFVCEYPPAALLTFLLPRLLTDNLRRYYLLFSLEMALPAIGLWWIALRMARLVDPHRSALTLVCLAWMFWIWTAGEVLLHRFDILVVFFAALAILQLLQRRWVWAGVWFGCGIAIKVYPVFLLLPACLAAWGDRRWVAAARVIGAASVAPLLSHLILLPWIGSALFSYFTYHSARGIEVESFWSPLMLFFSAPGSLHTEILFGCDQLAGAQNLQPWIVASYVLMLATNLLCGTITYLQISKLPSDSVKWRVRVLAVCLASVVFSIVTAKVLSIQYVLWLFPMAMILPGRKGMPLFVAYVAAMFLGQLWFPKYWPALRELTTPAMSLVFARNLVLLGIAVTSLVMAANYHPSEANER